MTYVWNGKGCLEHKGKFYAEGQIIPTGEGGVSDEMIAILKERNQIKKVSVGSVNTVTLKDAEKAFTNAKKRVDACTEMITKWTDDEDKDKVEEWTAKLDEAEMALGSTESVLSDLKAGE